MKHHTLPVFDDMSCLHRVFGDHVPSSSFHVHETVSSKSLLKSGIVEIKTRTWFAKTSCTPTGTIVKRYECFYDGILVDYTMTKDLIIKTFRWLVKEGQIHNVVTLPNPNL